MLMNWLQAAVAAGLVPLLAAWGDTADRPAVDDAASQADAPANRPTMAAAPRDACALASVDEVRTATGIDGSGASSTSGGAEVCTWSDATGRTAIVQLYPTVDRYESSRQAFQSLYGGTAENLTGIGEEAFYIGGATSSIPTATVSARRGGSAVSVQVMGMNQQPAELREQALALTRTVLSRL
jgi:hypothetical protein